MTASLAWLPTQPMVLAWLLVGLVAASLARGYAGFGFSAVLVASWALAVEPARAVVLALLLEVAASALQARSVWSLVPWRRVGLMLAGAALGTPAGVWLLGHVDAHTMRAALAAFVLAAALAMLVGWRARRRAGAPAAMAVGVASGLANGAVAMGGLPVALFFVAEGEEPARMRAAMIAYFFVLDALALFWITRAGLAGPADLAIGAAALPVLVAGMLLGARRFALAQAGDYRRFTLWLLAGLAIVGLARSLL